MEIVAGGSLGAEIAVSPVDDVQIDGEDSFFRPQRFDEHGEPCFHALAHPASDRGEKHASRGLLADRARTAQAPPVLARLDRLVDRPPVETMMRTEIFVFGRDDSADERIGDVVIAYPAVADGVAGQKVAEHLRCRRHRREPQQQNDDDGER